MYAIPYHINYAVPSVPVPPTPHHSLHASATIPFSGTCLGSLESFGRGRIGLALMRVTDQGLS